MSILLKNDIPFGNNSIRRFVPSDFSSISELPRGEAFPRLPDPLSSFLVFSIVSVKYSKFQDIGIRICI